MTNQNALPSEKTKSTAPTTKPSLFNSSPARRIVLSSIKKIHPQDSDNKINYWVDSMRSSSPTNLNRAAKNSPWMVNHPSALDMFDEMFQASKGKQIVVFLDYDGTLSPIVADPDRAFMADEMRGAVRELAKHFPTAIVTGRCIDKVYSFVKLSELYYAGCHGMDIKGPTNGRKYAQVNGNPSLLFQPAAEFLPVIDAVYKALLEKTKCIKGVTVEHNKFCTSVHFRRVDEKKWQELAEKVSDVISVYPKLKLAQGRKVFEIRPIIEWDKGRALEYLLESLGFGNSDNVFPIYIGDDRTDEDAFNVLRERNQGVGILVSKVAKETSASYTLQETSEVKSFLQKIVEWKRLSLRGSYYCRQ